MKFTERSYSGQHFRPKPQVHIETDGSLLLIATPWGARSGAEKAIQTIQDLYHSSFEDREMTSPFEILTCLSPMANNLRVAMMLANDAIYQEENRDEHTSGVELLAAARGENELVVAQVGLPKTFIARTGRSLMPLGGGMDLAFDFTGENELPLAPLPQDLLGLASTSSFSITSFRPRAGDRLITISRSHLPSELYAVSTPTLEDLTKIFTHDNPDQPFWAGIYEL